VVLLVLVLVLMLSTRTLGKLKRGALAVSGGDYSARVKVRSWDETGEIGDAFNRMATSVELAMADITTVSRGYSRFVSDKLIELLGKQSIKEIKPGDHANLMAAHILLFTDSFDKLRDKAFFDALGRFYDVVIPCAAVEEGLISRYSARGFAAMFKRGSEDALRAVLAMYAALDRLGDRPECSVFLSYSGAMLGVTGNGEHLNMITVSRLIYEYYAVGAAGKRFGARLIVEQSAFTEMDAAAEKYRRRFFGVSRVDNEDRPLYDFYDCDPPEIRLKKDETKEIFERAVRLYCEKEYAKARGLFVDIIKVFPEDAAAREYLRLAHAGQEQGGEPRPLFELR
jgi:HAMP domain-containing protein